MLDSAYSGNVTNVEEKEKGDLEGMG